MCGKRRMWHIPLPGPKERGGDVAHLGSPGPGGKRECGTFRLSGPRMEERMCTFRLPGPMKKERECGTFMLPERCF